MIEIGAPERIDQTTNRHGLPSGVGHHGAPAVRVELLRVPHCPNADAAQRNMQVAPRRLRLTAPVIDKVGRYPSPTVVIEGVDSMTGQPPATGACCRLDLPTHAQIIAALQHRVTR